jgi:hypothetical protein
MKQAALVVSDGECEIYNSLAEARLYLTANIEWILEHFGESHSVVKEDIIMVSISVTWLISGRRSTSRTQLRHDDQ